MRDCEVCPGWQNGGGVRSGGRRGANRAGWRARRPGGVDRVEVRVARANRGRTHLARLENTS